MTSHDTAFIARLTMIVIANIYLATGHRTTGLLCLALMFLSFFIRT